MELALLNISIKSGYAQMIKKFRDISAQAQIFSILGRKCKRFELLIYFDTDFSAFNGNNTIQRCESRSLHSCKQNPNEHPVQKELYLSF
jgi:hypothetical protein